jgi:hypothetical protein
MGIGNAAGKIIRLHKTLAIHLPLISESISGEAINKLVKKDIELLKRPESFFRFLFKNFLL